MPWSKSDRLIECIHAIARARSVSELSSSTAHCARELLNAQGSAFVLRDGDQCVYLDENSIEPLWKGERFPLTACVCGWTIRNGLPAIVPDVLNDPRIPAHCYQGRFMTSLLAVPMRAEHDVGALTCCWKEPHTATDDDVRALQTLADSAALGIENLKLLAKLETSRTAADRRAEEYLALSQHMSLMMRELDHRVKNTLAAVLGMCEATASGTTCGEDFQSAYRGRLLAMARTHESLASAQWHGARLREMTSNTVGGLIPGESGRLVIEGPDVLLPSTAALPIAVTLHELATNAVKYGAWSRAALPGRVSISWSVDAGHTLHMDWAESGGPAVDPPHREGVGTQMIRGMISHELSGRVDLHFLAGGVLCRITIPNADILLPPPYSASALRRGHAA